MDNVREKLVELLYAAHCKTAYVPSVQMYEKGVYYPEKLFEEAGYLLAHGVTVQEAAYWKDVMQINGECFGYCSNCLTEHKAQNYATLAMSHRHCRWCGRRLITTPFPQPSKGE